MPTTAWRLLQPWNLTPDNAVLGRHAVYTFQARCADRGRDGRILIAAFTAFPKAIWRQIWSNHPQQRLN
jgi:hypothetical protein